MVLTYFGIDNIEHRILLLSQSSTASEDTFVKCHFRFLFLSTASPAGVADPYMFVPTTRSPPPVGVAGWKGPTTEPALGPLDRINTTDVPEEIEAKPDKSKNIIFLISLLNVHLSCTDRQRERERERERERQRETERDRERERETDRQTDRQTDRERERAHFSNILNVKKVYFLG